MQKPSKYLVGAPVLCSQRTAYFLNGVRSCIYLNYINSFPLHCPLVFSYRLVSAVYVICACQVKQCTIFVGFCFNTNYHADIIVIKSQKYSKALEIESQSCYTEWKTQFQTNLKVEAKSIWNARNSYYSKEHEHFRIIFFFFNRLKAGQ